MKKAIAVLFASILMIQSFTIVYAGECKHGNNKQGAMSERLSKDLDLTPEQKAKIEVILNENKEKHKVEMGKLLETLKQETDQKIEAVLTPPQIEKFKILKAEHKPKMDNKMTGKHNKECTKE